LWWRLRLVMCETDAMDATALAGEVVRAWRGRRSQRGLSRHLGYASNVVNGWERGRRWPTASEAFAVARRLGHEPREVAASLLRAPCPPDLDPAEPAGVAALLAGLRGDAGIGLVAARCGRSRFAVSRWLRGRAEPRLPELLLLAEALGGRALDLAAGLADPDRLPSVRATRALVAARLEAARTDPWAQVVLAALCLHSYEALPAHDDGWVAARVGLTVDEVARGLRSLAATGQITRAGPRWSAVPIFDQTADAEAGRALKACLLDAAARRLPGAPGDQFAANFLTASASDVERLRELGLAFFHAVREVVATSQGPLDRVVVVNSQVFTLGAGGA
jgi:transcriptional regulator with XRE-family HTH domain